MCHFKGNFKRAKRAFDILFLFWILRRASCAERSRAASSPLKADSRNLSLLNRSPHFDYFWIMCHFKGNFKRAKRAFDILQHLSMFWIQHRASCAELSRTASSPIKAKKTQTHTTFRHFATFCSICLCFEFSTVLAAQCAVVPRHHP